MPVWLRSPSGPSFPQHTCSAVPLALHPLDLRSSRDDNGYHHAPRSRIAGCATADVRAAPPKSERSPEWGFVQWKSMSWSTGFLVWGKSSDRNGCGSIPSTPCRPPGNESAGARSFSAESHNRSPLLCVAGIGQFPDPVRDREDEYLDKRLNAPGHQQRPQCESRPDGPGDLLSNSRWSWNRTCI